MNVKGGHIMLFKNKKLIQIFIAFILVLSTLATTNIGASAKSVKLKVINTNSLNVRTGPSVKYKVIKTIKRNTVVTQTSTKGNWSKIKVGSKTGYASSKYLGKVTKPVSNPTTNVGKYYSVSAASLNVRKTSSATSTKLATAKFGDQFIIKSQASNGWFKIEYKKGKYGYVSNHYGYITKSKENAYPAGTIFGPLSGRTFVVDAGHGGSQAGAQYYGVKEKVLNLKGAKTLQKTLVKNGAKVVMTRTTDKTLSLEKRVSITKSAKPDAFISVHHNVYNKKSEEGYLALYTKKAEKTFTKYLFNALDRPVSAVSDVPAEEYRYQNLHVLRENPYIGTLMEYGYMNRKSELDQINTNSYRQAMADGITNGLISYFKKY